MLWLIPVALIVIYGIIKIVLSIREHKFINSFYNPSPSEINVTGAFRCSSCGGVTVITQSNNTNVCKYCNAVIPEIEQKRNELREAIKNDKDYALNREKLYTERKKIAKEEKRIKAEERADRRDVIENVFWGIVFVLFLLFAYGINRH